MRDERGRYRRPKISVVSSFVLALILWESYSFLCYCRSLYGCRRLDPPTARLTIVETTDVAPLRDFRRKTIRSITDPLQVELKNVRRLRASTRNGTITPVEFRQNVEDIQARLLAIMNEARLRRIPSQYEKKYKLCLEAIALCHKSLNELTDALESQDRTLGKSILKRSDKSWKKARRKNKMAREFFVALDKKKAQK